MNKKKIGLVVAIEMEAIFSKYPDNKKLEAPVGFEVYIVERENYELYIIKTGMGEIAASAGVQYLAAKYNVSMIINYGVVGGLTADMGKHNICVVERVVHYKYDCSEFMDLLVGQVDGHDSIFLNTDKELLKLFLEFTEDIPVVTCCSGDKFVGTVEEKQYLHNTFEGDICDMESSGIVLSCEMNALPCLLIKAVSDGLADGAEGFYKELLNASMKCLNVVDDILNKISLV